MKKLLTLAFILFLFSFMFGCTTISYKTQSHQDGDIAEIKEANRAVSVQENTIDNYINLIDKPSSLLISKYGNPKFESTLYGGDILYYEDISIAFGIDGDEVSSVLIYDGELTDGIKINATVNEVIKNLDLSEENIMVSNEFPEYILYQYRGYQCYLIFYEQILQEILVVG
ncbi:hypothetical protein GC105_08220 [Alkalibaculum sp. M08DMB]|uniref:Uncharacterized protein n=1 Tax=Alkalibaculum sporogenes TaxID=2655001 RepID=A0A6A7K8M5_9FIRM|nr:hypothetical protein [Alkalibaculum sporogenes]MPW25774.1 hypothetical protein [Alkalibaculum sporogenes]